MHAKAPSTLSELVLCFWRFVRGQSLVAYWKPIVFMMTDKSSASLPPSCAAGQGGI